VVNKHLLHDLTEMGVWTPALKNKIIYEDGSVQKMTVIPDDLKAIYKYVVHCPKLLMLCSTRCRYSFI
jgi:ribonucleoside-diphosphate reductase subunit M1